MKKSILALLFIAAVFCLISCSSSDTQQAEESIPNNAYEVYYINKSGTKLVSETHIIDDAKVSKLLDAMVKPENVELKSAIPDEFTKEIGYTLEESIITIELEQVYSTLNPISKVLCWTAIVKTLDQLEEVDSVSFVMNTQSGLVPVEADDSGNTLTNITAASIIDTLGISAMSIRNAELTLYFTNSDGTQLIKETREVNYNANTSIEKIVVTELLKGPEQEGAYATLPQNTKTLKVSVKDGTCYVNFDSTFITGALDIDEQIPLYSIVNSLCELSTVNKVQILVDGSSEIMFKNQISLDTSFERNLDLVSGGE